MIGGIMGTLGESVSGAVDVGEVAAVVFTGASFAACAAPADFVSGAAFFVVLDEVDLVFDLAALALGFFAEGVLTVVFFAVVFLVMVISLIVSAGAYCAILIQRSAEHGKPSVLR